MKIKDELYGMEEISEPVLVDMLSLNIKEIKNSFGILILMRRLNADLKEQIFSLLRAVGYNKSVENVLYEHGLNYNNFKNSKSSLIELSEPDLDLLKIDFVLKKIFNEANKEKIELVLQSLVNKNGFIVFKYKTPAEFFVRAYFKINNSYINPLIIYGNKVKRLSEISGNPVEV